MQRFLKQPFLRFQKPIDFIFSLVVIPAAFLLLFYRRTGSENLPLTTKCLKNIGLFPIRNHYYEPLFDNRQLRKPLTENRELPGVNLNVSGQISFINRLNYTSELIELKLEKPARNINEFYINNGSFESGDAEFLYQFIRAKKPAKIIEIGCGNSTKIIKIAREKNKQENYVSNHICIEPYEQPWLEEFSDIEIIRKRLEDCEIDWKNELKSGDLLFIDSSHIIRPQGDVVTIFLDILPQIAPGVYVHIHDIFTPKDYLPSMVINCVRFWNEQYLLEALLSNDRRYEIVAALNFLHHNNYDALKKICPYLTPDREPGSFYIRIRVEDNI